MSSYPRSAAVQVLVHVLSRQEPLDEALNLVIAESRESLGIPSVRAWLYEVCSGTLRWKGRLDWVLDTLATQKKPSGWLRKVLLIAAYQLIVQDTVPVGAVVSETVDEIKRREGAPPAGFANACLRKIAEQRLQWRDLACPVNGSAQEQSAWASLPIWFWQRLVEQHGLTWAQAYVQASLERPTTWIRTKEADFVFEKGRAGVLPHSWDVSGQGAIPELPGFQEGQWIVQDISSQSVVAGVTQWVLQHQAQTSGSTDAPSTLPTLLDLCAAPGGKAVGLAWNGFRVIATDRSEARVQLLHETVKRTGADVTVVSWAQHQSFLPGAGPNTWPNVWQGIWIDAPCSGSGILRRHPDVRWLRKEQDLKNLITIQKQLLKEAWGQLPEGGFLVYSVCSIFKDEGPEVIKAIGLNEYQEQEWSCAPQDVLGGDGFWAVLLKKRA